MPEEEKRKVKKEGKGKVGWHSSSDDFLAFR
jgi:hypothetical protein